MQNETLTKKDCIQIISRVHSENPKVSNEMFFRLCDENYPLKKRKGKTIAIWQKVLQEISNDRIKIKEWNNIFL